MKKEKPKDVDEYLAGVAEPARSTLRKVQATIRSVVPAETTETFARVVPREAIEAQCANVFHHVRAIMAAAGGSTDDIIKMNVFMADRSRRDALNAEWVKMFPDAASRPARHTSQASLEGGQLIVCDITAVFVE